MAEINLATDGKRVRDGNQAGDGPSEKTSNLVRAVRSARAMPLDLEISLIKEATLDSDKILILKDCILRPEPTMKLMVYSATSERFRRHSRRPVDEAHQAVSANAHAHWGSPPTARRRSGQVEALRDGLADKHLRLWSR